jgi:outer membrane protein, multidrug efflux system
MNEIPTGRHQPARECDVNGPSFASRGMARVMIAFLLLSSLCVSACMVGPDFTRPEMAVPETWIDAADEPTASEADLQEWWTVFNDATLTSLVREAFRSNLDLQIATARIRQARASRGLATSGIGPTVDASGSFRRSQAASGDSGVKSPVVDRYQVGFDAGWEIDIFGGVRRGVEAAHAQLQATVENRRDVSVTLAAEVARNYIDLRAYEQRLAIARECLETQRHSAGLTRQRFEGGFVSGLDVATADAQVATTEAQIPRLESAARQTIYALSVLVGREPGALVSDLSKTAGLPALPPVAPIGVPSDLLRRRPDVRMAEAGIHAATANIGVATADLFPRVTINASIGCSPGNSGDLLDSLARFWSIGPSVSWNLFQAGRTLSNIEFRKALQEESILAYRRTVLIAIHEVENALIASTKEQEHRESLRVAVVANRRAAGLATDLYTAGQTGFLNVLVAHRALYSTEDSLAQSNHAMAVELIALYKALGGGWAKGQTVAAGHER